MRQKRRQQATALDNFKASEYTESIDAGGAANEQARTDRRRVTSISKGTSNKRSGNRGNFGNLPVGSAAIESKTDDRIPFRSRRESEGSGEKSVAAPTLGSNSKSLAGRGKTDGGRFLEAVNIGNWEGTNVTQ